MKTFRFVTFLEKHSNNIYEDFDMPYETEHDKEEVEKTIENAKQQFEKVTLCTFKDGTNGAVAIGVKTV